MPDPASSPILIAGPTASGKSALALGLAERLGGALINADALQVYGGWRILTARPNADQEARAPHRLYGHVDPATPDYSVGRWLDETAAALERCRADGLRPIIVGGAGLNFTALTRGLADIPPIPPQRRAALEQRLATTGVDALAADLAARDPETATGLDLRNPRRVVRALEVLDETGRGMAEWARRTPPPLLPVARCRALVIETEVERLDRRIARRLDAMLAEGALDEVATMLARGLDWSLPAMKALGARPLADHLVGRIDLARARDRTLLETRRYAKRQRTWARNQLSDWRRVALDEDRLGDTVAQILRGGD